MLFNASQRNSRHVYLTEGRTSFFFFGHILKCGNSLSDFFLKTTAIPETPPPRVYIILYVTTHCASICRLWNILCFFTFFQENRHWISPNFPPPPTPPLRKKTLNVKICVYFQLCEAYFRFCVCLTAGLSRPPARHPDTVSPCRYNSQVLFSAPCDCFPPPNLSDWHFQKGKTHTHTHTHTRLLLQNAGINGIAAALNKNGTKKKRRMHYLICSVSTQARIVNTTCERLRGKGQASCTFCPFRNATAPPPRRTSPILK